jgi:hypothetical protein
MARIGEKLNACRILVGKNEGKRQLGKPGGRWEINMKVAMNTSNRRVCTELI